jgi:hypothetical protein
LDSSDLYCSFLSKGSSKIKVEILLHKFSVTEDFSLEKRLSRTLKNMINLGSQNPSFMERAS